MRPQEIINHTRIIAREEEGGKKPKHCKANKMAGLNKQLQ